MTLPMKLYVGDILLLKKNHPCGGVEWEVLRTGMDFRIKCLKCAHSVMIPRVKLEKDIKKVLKSGGGPSVGREPETPAKEEN